VTIDVTSREILSMVRNYDEETEELPEARVSFVKYPFVPGFGFYDIGLLHILGNTTNAVTAAWREMLDNGMFANFPGFLIAKSATRQQTTVLRIPPGAGQQVDTNGMKIQDAVMKLPYETSGQAALQGLAGEMAATGQRLGGTAEIATGEGKSDAPVGTTLALIDQATKIENSVHRRMHASQAAEFALLVRCFKEHPQSFWQRKGKSEYPWDEATFMQALALCEAKLVPQADPNTASHTQRLMRVVALKQLQGATPQQYDGIAVDTVALQTLGFSNPEQFFAKPEQQTQNPEIIKGLADIQNDGKRADAALISAKANMARAQGAGVAPPAANDGAETQLKAEGLKLKARELDQKAHESAQTFRNEQEDREADHHMEILRLARDVLKDHTDREDVAEAAQQAEALDQGIEGA
jgi:hypothetical protein